MTRRTTQEHLVYEQLLLTRYALQGTKSAVRPTELDRSATVLLARLEASGPLSVGELAEAFGLDISTVHRQVAAAMKSGLVERIDDPDGGAARKHRPTPEGTRMLHEELNARVDTFETVTADWSAEDLEVFTAGLQRLNEGIEKLRGAPWPRPER